MIYHDQLRKVGLSDSECKVYLYLLENGVSTPPAVAKGTKILRTNAYNVLKALKEKGLIEPQAKGKREAYLASDPSALVRVLERKKEEAERLLPDLRALYTVQKNKPKIKFYDGFGEVKEIYEQTLLAEEIFAIGSTKHLSGLEEKFFAKYLKDLKARKIIFHDILSAVSGPVYGEQEKAILGALYDYVVLPRKYDHLATDTLIWGDNVALVTLKDPVFGTVITNPLVADSFRIKWQVMKEGLVK